jgi:hypothetical protein
MKRTKKQKIKAAASHVNSQLAYKFDKSYNLNSKKEMVVSTEKKDSLGSIKKELLKSLIIASLILISLMVIYWVQN